MRRVFVELGTDEANSMYGENTRKNGHPDEKDIENVDARVIDLSSNPRAHSREVICIDSSEDEAVEVVDCSTNEDGEAIILGDTEDDADNDNDDDDNDDDNDMELIEEPKYSLQRETDYVPFPSQLENLLNSAKYFLQRKLGVSLDILPNHEVKIAAQDAAVVAIARSELLQILATPHLLQKELEDLQRQPVHVFVDESNIFLGAQTISHPVTGNVLRDPSIRLLPDALAQIVLNCRPAAQQVVVGSTHLRHASNKAWETERWKKWQDAGFIVHSEQRAFGSGESFVDDAIVAMVNAAILRFPFRGDHAIRRTIILLTGDGNLNHGRASFIEAVEAALRSGWKVEVWSWQHAINRNYLRMLNEYAHTGLLAVQSLDIFRDLVTCHHRPSHHDQTKRQQRRQRQPQRTSASSRMSTSTRRGTSRSSLPTSSSLSMSTSMSTKRKRVSRARKKKRSFKNHAPRHPRHATGHTVHIKNEQPRRRHPSQHQQHHHPIKREVSNVKAERK